jgi:GWxTD domain-containing protein
MKRMLFCLAAGLLVAAGLPGSAAVAQPAEIVYSKEGDLPDFFYDVVTSAAGDSAKTALNVYTKISYDELQFLRDSSGYKAKYELSATLFNKKGEQADGKILEKEVRLKTYAQTNSRKDFSVAELRFEIPPGNYELLLGLMDSDSKKVGHKKVKIEIPKYGSRDLTLSDIFFVDQIRADSLGRAAFTPNVTGNYAEKQDSLFFTFRIYNLNPMEVLNISWALSDMAGKPIRQDAARDPVMQSGNTVVVRFPKGEIRGGKYRLSLKIQNGARKAEKTKDISIHWAGMPAYTFDLDQAIEQLKWIAKGGEVKKMKKARGEEKQRLFNEFWKNMDPTPGTDENELQDEYYRRVDFANVNYTAFQPGWLSDRGMAYIILGPPNDIERHPFDSDSKPYEIWTYYRMNRDLIFIDTTGFGDYRLAPGTSFWELVERYK